MEAPPLQMPALYQFQHDRLGHIEQVIDMQAVTQREMAATLAEVKTLVHVQANSISRLWKFGMWAAGVTTTFLTGLLITLLLRLIT